jgi:hypothetical protein
MRSFRAVPLVAAALLFGASSVATAADVTGRISQVSSLPEGLLLMLEAGSIPSNRSGTPYNWLLIPEGNKTMIAVALLAQAEGRTVTVYSSGVFATTTP